MRKDPIPVLLQPHEFVIRLSKPAAELLKDPSGFSFQLFNPHQDKGDVTAYNLLKELLTRSITQAQAYEKQQHAIQSETKKGNGGDQGDLQKV